MVTSLKEASETRAYTKKLERNFRELQQAYQQLLRQSGGGGHPSAGRPRRNSLGGGQDGQLAAPGQNDSVTTSTGAFPGQAGGATQAGGFSSPLQAVYGGRGRGGE